MRNQELRGQHAAHDDGPNEAGGGTADHDSGGYRRDVQVAGRGKREERHAPGGHEQLDGGAGGRRVRRPAFRGGVAVRVSQGAELGTARPPVPPKRRRGAAQHQGYDRAAELGDLPREGNRPQDAALYNVCPEAARPTGQATRQRGIHPPGVSHLQDPRMAQRGLQHRDAEAGRGFCDRAFVAAGRRACDRPGCGARGDDQNRQHGASRGFGARHGGVHGRDGDSFDR
mmetsp:Transcript_45356/g.108177  ORF Transcript_45356/g.108177 Transcript_45356/m.108177 type:complete len:228 (+) Transcript_45356:1114-1797(+)